MEVSSTKPRSTAAGLLWLYLLTSKALVSCVGESCLSGFFCGGECLPSSKICDGIRDCSDGTDELTCVLSAPLVCEFEEFLCPSTKALCVSHAKTCNGINDCPDGFDERSCRTAGTGEPCLTSQFQCISNGTCIPIAYRCDQIGQCSDGSDEKDCMYPVVLASPPPSVNASAGTSITLSCSAAGTPPPFVTWLKDLQPLASSSRLTMGWKAGNGTLSIYPLRLQDSGKYSCLVSTSVATFLVQQQTTLIVNDSDPFTCQDEQSNTYLEGSIYYDRLVSTSGQATTAAADVVFVVDESGSMVKEHDWLKAVVQLLQSSLQEQGVGNGDRPNQFALVGFAAPQQSEIAGRLLTDFTSPAGFAAAVSGLSLDGSYEDGYSGMEYALDHVSVRSNTSRIMILVTDEDRSVLDFELDNDVVRQKIEDAGFVLNVVVNQGFLYGSSFALGIGQNNTAHVYDDTRTRMYSSVSGDIQYPRYYGYGNTFNDYVELALQLNGAAWDINQLRLGGVYSEAFTSSFVDAKVAEVMSVYRICLICSCQPPTKMCLVSHTTFAACNGAVIKPVVTVVTPSVISAPLGSSVTFECAVATQRSGFEAFPMYTYSWTYPNQSLVAVVGSKLTVSNVTLGSGGVYTCSVNNQSSSGLLKVLVPPSIVAASRNVMLQLNMLSVVNLSCNAYGVPQPYVHFARQDGQPLPSTAVTVTRGDTTVLTIHNFLMSNVGEYLCIANSIAGEARDSIKVSLSQCMLDGNDTILVGRNRFVLKTHQTADVILLVDESGSMSMEHRWIPNMVVELDSMLRKLGIGNSTRNRFGIVGFGGGCQRTVSSLGTVYSVNSSQAFYSSEEIQSIIGLLQVGGQVEDGYSAIETALKSYALGNASRLFILITDEDRSILNANLTRSYIQDTLHENKIVLNAAVSQRLYAGELRAIGVDVNQTAYVFDPTSSGLNHIFEGMKVKVPENGGYGHTREDYTQLAWGSGGAVWDLGLLRLGGVVTEAFTNAFVEANVKEIVAQTETCLNCSCTVQGLSCIEVSTSFCHPPPAVLPSLLESPVTFSFSGTLRSRSEHPVVEGLDARQNGSLVCRATQPATLAWTFEGGLLPSNTFVQTVDTNSSRLTIVNALLDNGGAYVCIGHSSDGLTAFAGVVNLEVYGTLDLSLSLLPRELVINRGCNASVLCHTEEPASFVWLFNYDTLPANVNLQTGGLTLSTMSIVGAVLENQGLYTCVANSTQRSISSSSTAFLNVIDPPLQLSMEPESLHAVVGGAVQMKCTAQNLCRGSKPTFQWSKQGTGTLNNQAKTETVDNWSILKIDNVTRADDGVYSCHAVLYSSVAESAIELRVDEPPLPIVIKVTSLQSLPVPVGYPSRFLCEASANTSLYWMHKGEIIHGDGSVSNGHLVVRSLSNASSLLLIYETVLSDVGTLTCISDGVFSNPIQITIVPELLPPSSVASDQPSNSLHYSPTATFSSGTLVVMPTSSASITPAAMSSQLIVASPSVASSSVTLLKVSDVEQSSISASTSPVPFQSSVYPSDIKLKFGQSATLFCEATSAAMLTWLFQLNPSLPINVEVAVEGPAKSSLTIHNMTADNSGDYICRATSVDGTQFFSAATVTFLETLTIALMPDSDVLVAENASINFTCTLTCGCSGTQLTWQRGSQVLPAVVMYSGRAIVLFLDNVKKQDEGTYTCVATNSILGETKADAHLQVNATSSVAPPLPNLSIAPGVLRVTEGSDANITCNSSQPAEFTWLFNYVNSLPANVEVQNLSSTVSLLKVVGASLSNAGSYYCQAVFTGGYSILASTDLIFIEMLKVEVRPASPLNVSNGTAFSVACSLACSCSGAQLSWSRVGYQSIMPFATTVLSDSGRSLNLSFPMVTANVGGEYLCEATLGIQPPAKQSLLLQVF